MDAQILWKIADQINRGEFAIRGRKAKLSAYVRHHYPDNVRHVRLLVNIKEGGINNKKNLAELNQQVSDFVESLDLPTWEDHGGWDPEDPDQGGGWLQSGSDLSMTPSSVKRNLEISKKNLRESEKRLKVYKDSIAEVINDKTKGGIDLNSANLNLQIKRDGKEVPLPISQQDLERINIDGLIPVIIDIKPVTELPLLAELPATVSSQT